MPSTVTLNIFPLSSLAAMAIKLLLREDQTILSPQLITVFLT